VVAAVVSVVEAALGVLVELTAEVVAMKYLP
jgi:hypothetical protein